MFKKLLGLTAALTLAVPALASGDVVGNGDKLRNQDPKVKFYSPEATGCMILRECKEDVKQVFSLLDVSSHYDDPGRFNHVADEFNSMLVYLNQIGVEVFLADSKYFPIGHRGVYLTVSNNFFLNKAFMHRPHVLMSVMRHEGWHAAQDCMAGTINNSLVAIILPEDSVPSVWRKMVESTYPPAAVPWEAEASWAGKTEGMTQKALESCAAGTMWSDYEPTPMTREWLQENNYLPHIEYDFYFYPREYHRYHHHNYQRHKHVHYHWRKDIIHSHKHSHGEGHRHHGRSSRHSRSKFHFH